MSGSTASAWWQLLRAGNVFTAVSNILAGFLLAHGEWQPVWPLVFLILSSIGLYLAGMVLNDVFDYEDDSQKRPDRPLPSGRISVNFAQFFGFELLLIATALGWTVSYLSNDILPGVIATLLAVAIILYDKQFMGHCVLRPCPWCHLTETGGERQ